MADLTTIVPGNNTVGGFGSSSIAPGGFSNLGGRKTVTSPLTSFGNPGSFTAAATKQASDYDTIMKNYSDIIASATTNPLTATPVSSSAIAPVTTPYSQSQDVTNSLSTLGNLSSTGGYSSGDIQDIRARDIAPIRGIYSQAQQNIERNKALTGGYAPNFDAATAKLTRDEAQQVSDATIAANAGIEQNVASNKIAAASPYASASATANAAKTAVDQNNTNIVNTINQANADRATQVGEFNTQAKLSTDQLNKTIPLSATQGMTSLYGTTPALTSTFGNQVMQANSAGQGQQELNNRKLATVSTLAGGY